MLRFWKGKVRKISVCHRRGLTDSSRSFNHMTQGTFRTGHTHTHTPPDPLMSGLRPSAYGRIHAADGGQRCCRFTSVTTCECIFVKSSVLNPRKGSFRLGSGVFRGFRMTMVSEQSGTFHDSCSQAVHAASAIKPAQHVFPTPDWLSAPRCSRGRRRERASADSRSSGTPAVSLTPAEL